MARRRSQSHQHATSDASQDARRLSRSRQGLWVLVGVAVVAIFGGLAFRLLWPRDESSDGAPQQDEAPDSTGESGPGVAAEKPRPRGEEPGSQSPRPVERSGQARASSSLPVPKVQEAKATVGEAASAPRQLPLPGDAAPTLPKPAGTPRKLPLPGDAPPTVPKATDTPRKLPMPGDASSSAPKPADSPGKLPLPGDAPASSPKPSDTPRRLPLPDDATSSASEPADAAPVDADALKQETMAIAVQLVEEFPEDALAHALLGSAYRNQGNSAEAIACLKRCLELDPSRADAYSVLATIAWEKGEFEQVVDLCRKALQIDPNLAGVHNRLGKALMDLGRTEELVRVMQRAVEIAPASSESRYLLGQGYLQSNEHAKAEASFQRAIQLQPDHTQAYFGLFTACARLGRREQASEYRRKFQELEAVDRKTLRDRNASHGTLSGMRLVRELAARTCTGAGQVYAKNRKLAKAEELWRRAATIDPQDAASRALLLLLYQRQNNSAKAVTFFESLARQQPNNALNHVFLGDVYSALRRYADAEIGYRKAVELSPQRPDGYRELVRLYLTRGWKLSEAKRLALALVELEPIAAHYSLLASACVRNGDRPEALAAIDRAIELDPEHSEYRALKAEIEEGP